MTSIIDWHMLIYKKQSSWGLSLIICDNEWQRQQREHMQNGCRRFEYKGTLGQGGSRTTWRLEKIMWKLSGDPLKDWMYGTPFVLA